MPHLQFEINKKLGKKSKKEFIIFIEKILINLISLNFLKKKIENLDFI